MTTMTKLFPMSITLQGIHHAYGSLEEAKKTHEYRYKLALHLGSLGTRKNPQFADMTVSKNGQRIAWCAEDKVEALGDDAFMGQDFIFSVQPGEVYEVHVIDSATGIEAEALCINVTTDNMVVDAAEYSHITKVVNIGRRAYRPQH